MKSKMEKIFEKILNDSTLNQEFSQLKTMDEIYSFLIKIDGDISKEKFTDFTIHLIKKCDRESIINLSEEELIAVSGGGGFDFLAEFLMHVVFELTSNAIDYAIDQLPIQQKHKKWQKENPKKAAAVGVGVIGTVFLAMFLALNQYDKRKRN